MKKIELNVSRVIYGLLGLTLTFDVLLSLSQRTLYENLSSVARSSNPDHGLYHFDTKW